MEFPKVLAAAKKAKGAEWSLADALVEEVGPRGSQTRFKECVEYLAERGIEYQLAYLMKLHSAARSFPNGYREPWLTPANALHAGSPAVVERAIADKKERAAEAGVAYTPPTQREMNRTRKVVREHARREEGRPTMPTRKAVRHAAEHATKSELGRVADVLELESNAAHARKDAREFMRTIAGTKLKAQERRDLLDDVDETLKAWQWVRESVENPLSDEIESWLDSLA